jgi:hypothetical protein
MADVKQPTNVGPFKLLKDQGDGTHAEVVAIGGSVTSTGGTVAQGSTTSGQSGVLSQGAVTTAAPTYTTGQTDPLSLTIFGGLRSYLLSSTGAGALSASLPTQLTESLPIRLSPQKTWRADFDNVVASGVDTSVMTVVQTGAGMAISQASGSLTITSGTTTYSESIIRSTQTWMDSFELRYFLTLSQRIANNDTYVELVDLIGDGLAFTVTNATTIVVTVPGTTWTTAQNAGQGVYIGTLSLASCLSQRATIASVSGTAVTLTVSGFPGSGSGTCSLFGWNYHHVLYTSNTATNALFGTQRNGWQIADITATINTSASGHLASINNNGRTSGYTDKVGSSSSSFTPRASSDRNIPASTTPLYLQIRVVNGSSAPGSTTTATIDFLEVDNFVTQQVSITDLIPIPRGAWLPTEIMGNNGLTFISGGTAAHSAASSGNPVRMAGRVNTAADTTLIAGDVSDLFMTPAGQLVVKDFATADIDWVYAAASGGIANTTTAVTIKAAAGAGIRNYVTGLTLSHDALGGVTEFAIRDGAAGTVIWRQKLQTTATEGINVVFPTPLRGSAATLLEIVTLTAVTGGVFASVQGYSAA